MIGRKYLVILLLATFGFLCALSYRALYPRIIDYRQYRLISRFAEKGDSGYQRLLGEYFYDKGDFESALVWNLRAAEGGDAIAQDFMGIYFSTGINEHLKPAAPDYAKAREWHEKAAAQGDPGSQTELCEWYQTGLGIPADQEAAYFWCALSDDSRVSEFKNLSRNALDPEARSRVESRVAAYIDSHGKNHW